MYHSGILTRCLVHTTSCQPSSELCLACDSPVEAPTGDDTSTTALSGEQAFPVEPCENTRDTANTRASLVVGMANYLGTTGAGVPAETGHVITLTGTFLCMSSNVSVSGELLFTNSSEERSGAISESYSDSDTDLYEDLVIEQREGNNKRQKINIKGLSDLSTPSSFPFLTILRLYQL